MIHDASVEVTCDGARCASHEMVELEWRYRSTNPDSGFYDADDSAIEIKLETDYEWLVIDGKHYCSEDCKERE